MSTTAPKYMDGHADAGLDGPHPRRRGGALRAAGAAYFEHTADLCFGYVDPRCAEMLGYAPEEVPDYPYSASRRKCDGVMDKKLRS